MGPEHNSRRSWVMAGFVKNMRCMTRIAQCTIAEHFSDPGRRGPFRPCQLIPVGASRSNHRLTENLSSLVARTLLDVSAEFAPANPEDQKRSGRHGDVGNHLYEDSKWLGASYWPVRMPCKLEEFRSLQQSARLFADP